MSKIKLLGLALMTALAAHAGDYRVLATTRTSTMEKELNEAARDGYRFHQVMGGKTAVGGQEVVVIMERGDGEKDSSRYRVLATSRTSRMQHELNEAGKDGFQLIGFIVTKTELGGEEIVSILRKN
jgi:hypothetical protein